MSAFGGLILTTKGRNLQAKAQAGAQLNFTRVGVGDGELAGSSVLELNALKHEVKTLNITKLKPLTGGKATVGGILSNQGLVAGFYWRELGLFARDPDIGEILYCYGNSGANAEYIPADGGPDVLEKSIDIISIVGNAANVTATIEQSLVFATANELAALSAEIDLKETPAGAQTKATAAETAAKIYADTIVAALVDSSPGALNTLNELAAALGDDPNFATTVLNQIATKADASALTSHVADYVRQPGYGTTAGAANTYTLTPNPAITAYAAGQCFAVKIHATNTGASTFNVSGKGAIAILDSKGAALIAGKLTINSVVTLRHNGTAFILQGEGGDYGTAGAAQALETHTVGTPSGVVQGTIPIRSGDTVTTNLVSVGTTLKLRPSVGYRDGVDDYVTFAEANWTEAKIPIGTTMFGKVGTLASLPLAAGENVIAYSGIGMVMSRTLAYSEVWHCTIRKAGVIRVKFELGNYGGISYGKVYKNGAPVGVERVDSVNDSVNVQFTEDFTVAANDIISIWKKSSTTTDEMATIGKIQICTADVLPIDTIGWY